MKGEDARSRDEPFVGLLDDLTSGGLALAEDAEGPKVIQSRAQEPNLDFDDVVRSLRRRGKL